MHTSSAPADSGRLEREDLVAVLSRRLPAGALQLAPERIAGHLRDENPVCEPGQPLALVRPTTTAEVSTVLEAAQSTRTPVVVQGARTGVCGGATAIDGALLLSMESMNHILEIDPVDQVAVVQPGVLNADLSRAAEQHALFYPPDPGSWQMSSIGGNVATNAGGLCCVKYGVTGDYVRGLEFVLPGGSVMRAGRRTVKGVAGYDLTRLLVGSEGTLAAITEITVALVPAPEVPLTAVGVFRTLQSAARAVIAVRATGRRPALLELLDGPSIAAINAFGKMTLPEDAGAILLIQSDREPLAAAADLEAFRAAFLAEGAVDVVVAEDAAESQLLLEARRLLGPALTAQGTLYVDDVCVPVSRLAELVDGVGRIGDEYGVRTVCPGHAGDGNLHPAVFFDAKIPSEVRQAEAACDAIMALGLQLGGTITGEHGVGVVKRSWLERELGADMIALQRRVKDAFDPHGLMNPGKVFE